MMTKGIIALEDYAALKGLVDTCRESGAMLGIAHLLTRENRTSENHSLNEKEKVLIKNKEGSFVEKMSLPDEQLSEFIIKYV